MPVRPMIYGSGQGDNNEAPPPEAPSPLTVLNEILMAPVNLLSMTIGAAIPEEEKKKMEAARYTRAFLPQGGVKPSMTTRSLKDKNIFGSGGGY